MLKVKDVQVIDNRGNAHLVTGVLSDDHRYVVASQTRTWVGDWKESGNQSGNQVRSIGFGETCIFRADNVSALDTEFATADLDLIMGPLSIRAQEIKGASGIITSINSFLDENHGMGKNAKQFKTITNKFIADATIESLNVAGDEMNSRPAYSINSKVARAQAAFMTEVGKFDQRKKTIIKTDTNSEVSGNTADELLE